MIFNMVGGGGGSGATLVVSSPANVSVTVSKDDKSYTKNSGSLGSATFKGLATGTWTVTISGNGQTATKTIKITADYAITIAFFSASINITYPANSTCVVTNSGGQTVASDTNATSSEKTWTATVNATGTYTVTATATDGSGKTKSQSVSITTDGQSESVTLAYQFWLFRGTDNYIDPSVGGWSSNGYRQGTSAPSGGGGIAQGMLYCIGSNGDYEGCNGTVNAVNLTPYKALKASVTCTDSNNSFFLVVSAKNPFDQHIVAKQDLAATSQDISISLDGINGNYYIVFTSSSQTNGQTKVWNAYLE